MRIRLSFILSFFILGLLLLPILGATSQNPRDRRPLPVRDREGFRGESDVMNVTGTISIEDAISMTVSIKPTAEFVDRLNEAQNRRNDSNRGFNFSEFEHSISVKITELVEFEDLNDNGLDENDTIVSSYPLNDLNLNDVDIQTDGELTTYQITSVDGVFSMDVILNITKNTPHAWKWTVTIDYPFQSDSSDLAILNVIETDMGNVVQRRAQHREDFNQDISKREFRESNGRFPVFFKWIREALVDGSEVDVKASRFDNSLALSMDQGDLIEYDPSIGVEPEILDSLDNDVANVLETELPSKFIDGINSPRGLGILIAAVLISSILVITYRKK